MTLRSINAASETSLNLPTVGAGVARGLVQFAVGRGADERRLLELAGVDASVLSDGDARLPLSQYVSLMRAAKAVTGDGAFALHFGESVDLSDISPLGVIGVGGATMQESLGQLNRYVALAVDLPQAGSDRFQLVRFEGRLRLVDTRPNPNDFPELTESTFARMICSVRRLGAAPFVIEVHVTHDAPLHRAEYERILRVPVRFGSDENALVLEESWLEQVPPGLPRYASDLLRKHAEALLARMDTSRSLAGRVEALLVDILRSEKPSVVGVASRMGLSRQSLFRKLKEEGVTFEAILDRVRFRMAQDYLEARRLSVSEAAFKLQFSDAAAFSRAFKRWTGLSPRDYLLRLAGPDSNGMADRDPATNPR